MLLWGKGRRQNEGQSEGLTRNNRAEIILNSKNIRGTRAQVVTSNKELRDQLSQILLNQYLIGQETLYGGCIFHLITFYSH